MNRNATSSATGMVSGNKNNNNNDDDDCMYDPYESGTN